MTVSMKPSTDAAANEVALPAVEPQAAVMRAVERLERASRTGLACAPVRDLIGESDLALAYAVQQLGPMHSVTGGTAIRAEISGLGTVGVTFAAEPDHSDNPTTNDVKDQ